MACAEEFAHFAMSVVENVVLSEGSVWLRLLMKMAYFRAHQTLPAVGYTLSSTHHPNA